MEELRERVRFLQTEVEPILTRAWADAIENQEPEPLEFIAERLLAHSGAIQVTRAADRLSRRSSATEGAEAPLALPLRPAVPAVAAAAQREADGREEDMRCSIL